MAMKKRSHQTYTETLIKAADLRPKPTQGGLAKRFEIGRSTVNDILKKHATYLQSWEENQSRKWRQLSKETNLSQLNQLVYDFFYQARAKSIPITGGLLKA